MDKRNHLIKTGFLLAFVSFCTVTSVGAQDDERHISKELIADFASNGSQEKAEMMCRSEDGKNCLGFEKLQIVDRSGKTLYEMKSELDPEVGAFVNKFEVDDLFSDGKKQLVIGLSGNAAMRICDFRIIAFVDGKFSEIFKTDFYGTFEFNDLLKDGNKEMVERNGYGKIAAVYSYSDKDKTFVETTEKFEDLIKNDKGN